ncbi:MAG: YIP1 family protein [Defluviitaleaceae bacterium]|nr:YIP1 family protein [Defluviitaleaceae bacterium]
MRKFGKLEKLKTNPPKFSGSRGALLAGVWGQRHHGFKVLAIMLVLIALNLVEVSASGANTTVTFAVNRMGWAVRTQDAYLPNMNIVDLGLSEPQSMVFGENNLLYIADTGNRRILVFDTTDNTVFAEFTFDGFNTPRGVFVTPDNRLYVADALAGSVFILDALTGEHLRTHTAPQAMTFGETPFAPNRVAVDIRGNMYIVGEGVFAGIIQLSSEGEFLGFFASNQTTRTFLQMLQDTFFTEAQRQGLADRLPATFSGVTVDRRGVVYTSTMVATPGGGGGGGFGGGGGGGTALQRHNMAGRNTIQHPIPFAFLSDVHVDDAGFIYVSTTGGIIAVFTNDGELIFFFQGGWQSPDDVAGWFQSLQGIAVADNGEIWALDSTRNFLQSFTPTEYAQTVFSALSLFNSGLYEESAVMWNEVLRHNQMSVLAHVGLGRSSLQQQNFNLAMSSFYLANHRDYYSAAFWEVRNAWLMRNLAPILIGVFILFLAMSIVRNFDRRRVVGTQVDKIRTSIMQEKHIKNAMFAFSVARHPINSYYDMKHVGKGSVGGAAFHFVLFFLAYLLYNTSMGFLLQFTDVANIDFTAVIGGFFAVFVLFVFCNYLVTSINDGEGSVRDIFKLVSYAMFPMTITLFGVVLLSHIITQNEVFLLQFTLLFGGIYTISVLLLGLQEIHDYTFRQNIKSLLITAVFMLIGIVVIFNLTVLFGEIWNFFESIIMEVYASVMGLY